MNQSQISSIAKRFPLSVIISMRHKRPVNHGIDIDAIKADGHIEDLVLLRGPKNLLIFYDSIFTAHSVVENVCLTRVCRVFGCDSVHNDVNIVGILF